MNSKLDNPKRVAIYVRVSTQEQAEHGYSIEAQLKTLHEYCRQSNKVPYEEYIDGGISGKSINGRPQLNKMMLDGKNGLFDEVIVWKINRLSRNQKDLITLVDELNKHNITFRSYSENFETETPIGRFALQMMGSVAELERNTIVDNVKMGMKQRAKQGNWNGGIVLGYKSVGINTGDRKSRATLLEVIPEESLIVQKIFNLYANGKGLKAITNLLNHEGYKTKKGNPFNVNGVKDILHNPVYIGKIRFGQKNINNCITANGKHTSIISKELWDKVQSLYKIKSGKPPKVFDGSYPLTGLIRCPVCGAGMVAHRTKKKSKDGNFTIYRYYACGQWRNKGTAICKANSVRADYAENYILSRIHGLLSKPNVLKDIVENINNKRQSSINPLKDELITVNKELGTNDKKLHKYLDLYCDETIPKNILSERLKDLHSEKESLLKRKQNIECKLHNENLGSISYDYVKHILHNFSTILKNTTSENQKSLLQLMIKNISVTTDKKIDKINLNFDENTQYHLSDNKLRESSTMEDFSLNQKSYPLLMIRFTLHNPKTSIYLL